jgi:hypothetical protein
MVNDSSEERHTGSPRSQVPPAQDDDNDEDDIEQQQQQQQDYYEYLGYPTVLFRHRDCYTFRDVLLTTTTTRSDSNCAPRHAAAEDLFLTTAEEFCDQQAHLSRCWARWYYPTDHMGRAMAVTPDFYPDAMSLLTGQKWQPAAPRIVPRSNNKNSKKNKRRKVKQDVADRPEEQEKTDGENQSDADHTEKPSVDNEDESQESDKRNTKDESSDDKNENENVSYATRAPIYPHGTRLAQMRKRRLESMFCTSADQPSTFPEDTYLEAEQLSENNDNDRDAEGDKNPPPPAPAAFPLQDVIRANMLRSAAEQMQKPSWELDRLKLRTMQTLDANYLAQWPGSSKAHKSMEAQTLLDLSAFYDRERMDCADPAYQASFPLELVRDAASSSSATTKQGKNQAGPVLKPRINRINDNDHYAPHLFGNCIHVGQCDGDGACDGPPVPVMYILHPVGPLLDRIRLSFLRFPRRLVEESTNDNDDDNDEVTRGRRGGGEVPSEIQLDDRLLQLVKCGDDPISFVARTLIDVTVFSLTFVKPPHETEGYRDDNSAKLTLIHRINHVSWSRHELSYRPRYTTAHPEFASCLTPSRIATVYHCSTNGESNFIRTLSVGASTFTEESYTVKNLQEITDVEYYHSHPMVLWAVGRSFVRPALEAPRLKTWSKPRLGLGSALYTVDLRDTSEKAVFQWSPSAEEYFVEGIQSVSGIANDPYSEYRLWVASSSTQKTWELDCRMPCRSVCSYTLPYLADVPPKLVDKNDQIGSGMLFCFPQTHRLSDNLGSHLPVLAVSKRPRAYGIHCYHRHTERTTFQKRATEVFAGPVFPVTNVSLIKSSIFGLPEGSDAIFHCGLAAFEGIVEQYLDPNALPLNVEPRDVVLSTISMTNKGDLYSHTMLRSTSPDRHGVECPSGVLAGSSILELPRATTRCNKQQPSASDRNILSLTVSNCEPLTSTSIDLDTSGFTSRPLDPFELRGRTMNLRGSFDRKQYLQRLNRCFPPVNAFKDSEDVTVDDQEDFEFTAGDASIQLSSCAKPEGLSGIILRQSVSSSKSYKHVFDVRPSVLETVEEEEPRSDLTRAVLESMWLDDSDSGED